MVRSLLVRLFKVFHFGSLKLSRIYSSACSAILFYLNGVKIKSLTSYGVPYIHVSMNASCIIGNSLRMNNGARYSDSGLNGRCRIEVRDRAVLRIGDNVGMSDATITCHQKITIGNNVLLGVGTQIRDTDNHSLNPAHRKMKNLDWRNKRTAPIELQDNVFIGANSIILKGVTIGRNSIIGAGSVIRTNVPANEIWAGNPGCFVKKMSSYD